MGFLHTADPIPSARTSVGDEDGGKDPSVVVLPVAQLSTRCSASAPGHPGWPLLPPDPQAPEKGALPGPAQQGGRVCAGGRSAVGSSPSHQLPNCDPYEH